jgi:hypothetical protein
MKKSTPILLAHLDAWLAEINDDLILLEKTRRPSLSLKRSFASLRRQIEAAKKTMGDLSSNGSTLTPIDTSMLEPSTSGDIGNLRI